MTSSLPWVLLPGWGMSAASLQPLKDQLPGEQVTLLDWPTDPDIWQQAATGKLDPLLQQLAAQAPEGALWLGWSLGGLVAAKMAEHPELKHKVQGLVTLGSGPWFVGGKTRPCGWGLNPAELKAFIRGFKKQPREAWQHFLRWQSQGEPQAQTVLSFLKKQPFWSQQQLQVGLELLQALEAGELLNQPSLPWLLVRGAKDPLCPEWEPLQKAFPAQSLDWLTLPETGHLPQFSQADKLARQLLRWSQKL